MDNGPSGNRKSYLHTSYRNLPGDSNKLWSEHIIVVELFLVLPV